MAPTRMAAPRTKRAPQNLANIGVEGRATALTMAERPKDEHGMEIMDNWYSSPVITASKRGKAGSRAILNGISNHSEELGVAQDSVPESSNILVSGPLTREKRRSLPLPPHARSPLKTNLGATPLRGTPRSGATPPISQAQNDRPAKSPRRLLDFSTNEPSRSSLRSGFKIRRSDAQPDPATAYLADGNGLSEPASAGYNRSKDINDMSPEHVETSENIAYSLHGSPPPGMGDDNVELSPQNNDEQNPMQQTLDESVNEDADTTVASIEVDQNENSYELPSSPEQAEASVGGDSEPSLSVEEPRRKPFSKRDPNQKRKAPSKTAKTAHPRAQSAPRPLQRQRAQTPAEEDGVLQTRSGRNVYKPLAYWKGEHALFEDHTYQQNLKQIIRMEDVTPQKRPHLGQKKKRKYTVFEDPDFEDHAEEEPWEINDGIVSAPVRTWDPDLAAAPPGSEFEQQLAFASARIQPRASPDNPNFFFTKTLTMPFFGAGVIEIPPGGHKGTKNSRRFQFIFFVHYGKVQVELAGTSFTITKGGMWQVPRGNFYSMSNQTEHPAKIFFAQSCELQPEPATLPSLLENLN